MPTYRKRPVEIEARQLLDDLGNHISVVQWVKDNGGEAYVTPTGSEIVIVTLEGNMRASLGDWIIRGVKGEFYPCKPDIFDATYEPVNADDNELDVIARSIFIDAMTRTHGYGRAFAAELWDNGTDDSVRNLWRAVAETARRAVQGEPT